MACFLVPTTEAIVTSVIKHAADKKGTDNIFIKKMGWLNNMLWGGSALLAFEHVWHGEVTPWFPFILLRQILLMQPRCSTRWAQAGLQWRSL